MPRKRRGALPLAPRFFFGRQRSVRAGERARIHQQAMRRCAHVEGPEVEAILVVVAGAQVGARACRRARILHAAQCGPLQIGRGKQALERQVAGARPVAQGTEPQRVPSAGCDASRTFRRAGKCAQRVCYTAVQNHCGSLGMHRHPRYLSPSRCALARCLSACATRRRFHAAPPRRPAVSVGRARRRRSTCITASSVADPYRWFEDRRAQPRATG